jgi:hypothetical protein
VRARSWLLLLFGLGSIHFSAVVGGGNWLLSHLVVTVALLLMLLELVGRNRPWLVGVLLGLATLSRPSAWFLLPFPLLASWAAGGDRRQVLRQAVLVGIGLAPIVGFSLWYNWARFDDPFRSGYATITMPRCLQATLEAHGVRNLAYLPKNLYLTLFHGPEPIPGDGAVVPPWGHVDANGCASATSRGFDATTLAFPYFRPSEWGMGLLWTTPAVVWAVTAPWRDRWVKLAWLTVASSLLVIGTYVSPGWIQFGARYTLDFLPFLLFLIVRGLPATVPRLFKALVVLSVLVECWGIALTVLWR